MSKGNDCAGVTYNKNKTPSYCCPVCSNQFGKLIGMGCKDHTAEQKQDYRERENKTKEG